MKRGFLSFAVAAFVLVVLFYFVSSVLSLEDYQLVGQKRLEARLLSQRYQDALSFLNATVYDAITDSAFASSYSSTCNAAPSGTLLSNLNTRVQTYLDRAAARLNTGESNVAYSCNAAWGCVAGWKVRIVTSAEPPTPQPVTVDANCAVPSSETVFQASRVFTEIDFLLNVTSRDGASGYINRPMSFQYETLLSYKPAAAGSAWYLIQVRPQSQVNTSFRCLLVTGC